MKSRTRAQAERKLRQVKGKARETAGKIFNNNELEDEAREKMLPGK